MPGNIYDDDLEQLADAPTIAPARPAPDPVEELDALDLEQERRLRQARISSQATTPDRAAEIENLSTVSGLPREVIERNFETLSKRIQLDAAPYKEIIEQTPHLAEWSSKPENAAVARDDMEQLGLLEWIVSAPGKAFAQSMAQMRLGELRAQSLYRELTTEERDQVNAEKFASTKDGEIGARGSWFKGAATGSSQFLANVLYGGYRAGPMIVGGAIVGGAIGGIGGSFAGGVGALPGAVAGAKFGAKVGGMAGGGMFSFQIEAGLAYDEYLDYKDELGKPLDPAAAKAAALATGVLNAAMEVGGLEVVLKTIPGIEKLGKQGVKEAVQAALRNPTVRAGLATAVKEYAGALTAETAVEVGQRAITILSGELAKAATGTGGAIRGPLDVAEDLAREGAGAVQSFALGLAIGPGFGIQHKIRQARQAEKSEAFFLALADGVKGSKLIARLPEAAQAFLEQATKDGPVPNVYAPVETFTQYWQSKGLDPAEVAAQLTGNPEAYAAAVNTGEDLVIPTARYAVKLAGGEHAAFFAEELRLHPDDMNRRESIAFEAQLKATQDAAAEAAATEAEAAIPPAEQVHRKVVAELVAAGVAPEAAAKQATLYADTFDALLTRAGMDPLQVYEKYGLTVSRPAIDPARAAAAPAARRTAAPAAPTTPTATFLGYMEGWGDGALPLYNIQGGDRDRSTVSAETLAELGIPIPETPPDTGEQISGEELRARAQAAALGGYAGPERRSSAGAAPDGAERRRSADEPINAMDDVLGAAQRMREENPNIDQDAAALQARAQGVQRASRDREPAQAGTGLPDADPQSVDAPGGRNADAGSEGDGPATGAVDAIPPSAREFFGGLLTGARSLGYAGSDNSLAARFNDLYTRSMEIAADLSEVEGDTNWRGFLTAIAKAGGIGLDAEKGGYEGEVKWFLESFGSGTVGGGVVRRGKGRNVGRTMPLVSAGIPGVPRVILGKGQGGRSLDTIRESLQQEPQWSHLEDLNDFLQVLEAAVIQAHAFNNSLPPPGGNTLGNVFGVMEGFYGVKATQEWWLEAPADLLNPDDLLESDVAGADAGDTSFNPREFGQGLFDELEAPDPTADVLVTGEQQPRLPGDVGAVREAEVSTPELEAPFALTPEVSQRKGKQTTLFQAAARTPADLDAWLRNSVVTTPLYHGTKSDRFGRFRTPAYFTTSSDEALNWADGSMRDGDSRVVEAYLRIENPVTVEAFDDIIGWSQQDVDSYKAQGYDGAVFRDAAEAEDIYIAFDADQVRNAKGPKEYFQSAYHGTPHRFERFSLQEIGTGEGHQAYGWGLYFASKREVAERYREILTGPNGDGTLLIPDGRTFEIPAWVWGTINTNEPVLIQEVVNDFTGRIVQAERDRADSAQPWMIDTRIETARRILDAVEAYRDHGGTIQRPGRTFTVEIPDDGDYLEWDKPASGQSPKVQAELKALGLTWETAPYPLLDEAVQHLEQILAQPVNTEWGSIETTVRETLLEGLHFAQSGHQVAFERWHDQHRRMYGDKARNPLGRELYVELGEKARTARGTSGLFNPQQLASEALAAAGIPGIKYLDGFSRSAGEGTYNYVIFDDKLIEVTEFNQLEAELTERDLRTLEDQLKAEIGPDLKALSLALTPAGDLALIMLAVERGAQRAGLGSRVMQEITRFADQHGKRITLSPGERDREWGTTSRVRLVKFYQRFGFVENKGRRKDFRISAGMYREPTVSASSLFEAPATALTVQRLEDLATDEAMGVNFDGREGSEFPDGSAAIVCTNCAEQIIKTLGRGEVFGWEEGSNPTSVVSGPDQGAHTDTGQGHDFAIIDGRFLVDPWAKNVEGSSDRAAFDLNDPDDRREVLRLYGNPAVWIHRIETSGGDYEWVSEAPAQLLQAPAETILFQTELELDPPPFYSRLVKAVEEMKQAKAPGAQWKAAIRGSKLGINQEEYALASVQDLEDGKTYTKQEVLDYLTLNTVTVVPVALTDADGPGSIDERELERRVDRAVEEAENQAYADMEYPDFPELRVRFREESYDVEEGDEESRDGDSYWTVTIGGELLEDEYRDARRFDTEREAEDAADTEVERRRDSLEEDYRQDFDPNVDRDEIASEIENEMRADLPEGGTHYGEYVEKGPAEEYEEVFLTAPVLPVAKLSAEAEELKALNTIEWDSRYHANQTGLTPAQADRRAEIIQTTAAPEELRAHTGGRPSWVDGHDPYDNIQNPIVRLRLNIRIMDGQRTLFLEEIQTPQPQNFRKMPALFQANWREVALKFALRYAVEKHATQLAWTTGEMQAERYSLTKVINKISFTSPNATDNARDLLLWPTDGGYRIKLGVRTDGSVESHDARTAAWEGADLADVVGKELADEIRAKHTGTIEGADLEIGGKGLKQLYDQDFGRVVNKLAAVKKAGVRMGAARGTFKAIPKPEMLGVKVIEVEPNPHDPMARWGIELEDGVSLWGRYETPEAAQRDMLAHNELQERRKAASEGEEVPAIPITPELAALVTGGQALWQTDTGPRRKGSIRFGGASRQVVISLFERADLSTFLHESGHFFLEVFGDVHDRLAALDPSTLSDSQRQVMADYQAILRHVGVPDRASLGEPQHEEFARTFEAYLMTGQAPSLTLQSAFASFRAWLLGVYRSLKTLNVNLTPEVRAVLDRMVATDRAIAEAQAVGHVAPMFLTAEQAGMDEATFALYQKRVETASRTAREQLEVKLLAEVQREQEADWKAKRAIVLAEVTAEIHGQPVYRALAGMQRGTNPDGTPLEDGGDIPPLKLSRAMLVGRFGKERLKRLPKPYIYSAEGGLDPDVVADLFGFSSGDEMLTAVEQAPPAREVIEARVAQRMLADYGSILLDGTLQEQARAALSNEDREIVIRAELRALGQLRRTVDPFVNKAVKDAVKEERKERAYERRWFEAEAKLREAIAAGRKQVEIDALTAEVQALRAKARGGAVTIRAALPPDGAIRSAAQGRIARTRFRDLNPAPFWSASRRAATKAIEAAARQDFDAAITAKQQELLNLALYREASRVREALAARVKQARALGSGAARARLGLAGEAYLDQVDGILDRFEFATVSRKVLDRRASLRRFVAGLEGEGLPVDLPEELLEESRRVNYQELSVDELSGVLDGLDQILHLARLKNRLLKNQQQRELAKVAGDLATSIRAHKAGTPTEIASDRRPEDERRRTIGDFFGSHRKLASILREMDGFQDGGPAWEAIMLPLNEAGAREAELNATATTALAELVETAFPGRAKQSLYTRMYVPSVGKSLSRMQRIMLAANWGNEGNRERVRKAHGWDDGQVQGVLDTLSSADLQFVQGLFDFINGYWPEIEAKQKRVFGVAPDKVEATPIRAANGEIAGGYFPLKYDDRSNARAMAFPDLEAANLARQAAYAQATTKRGHTKERVSGVKLPVRLDFGVLFEHVGQVIHDLSHHEALIDVGRILGHAEVQQAILETHGDLVYKQIRNAIRDVAFGDVPAKNGVERSLNHIRMGATVAGLGWNLTTSLLQPIGLTNAIARIGYKWVAVGLSRWLRSPTTMIETVKWIEDQSSFMRSRGRTQQREINEIRNTIGISSGRLGGWIDEALTKTTFDTVTRQGIADSYFWMIQQMQRVADVPTWLGQYEKSLAAGETEERAVHLADQAVLDSQGGGQTKDLAQVQRGGPMFKIWTNFYSYFNVVYNQAAETNRRTNWRNPVDVGRAASDYLMLFIVPATLGFLVREAMRPGGKDDGEDDTAYRLGLEVASTFLGTMVGLREASGLVSGLYGYEGPAGARAFSEVGKLVKQAKQGELDAAFWKSLNATAGILLHFPAGQVYRTLAGATALMEGTTSNPAALIAGPPKAKK